MNKYEYKFFSASQSEQAELWKNQKFAEGFDHAYEQKSIFGPDKGQTRIIVSKGELSDSESDRIFEQNQGVDDAEEESFEDMLRRLAASGNLHIRHTDGDDSDDDFNDFDDDDDFEDEDDEEDDGGSFSVGFGLSDDGNITPLQSDGEHGFSFSFTLDEDGEEVPEIRCPRCNKKDTEELNGENDTYRCNSCGYTFVPEMYKTLYSADAYLERADINFKQSNYKRSIKDANAALALEPNNRRCHLFLGRNHEERGELEQAEANYSEAIRLSPDYDIAYYQRGRTRMLLGKYDLAIADLTKSIGFDPDYAETYRLRAVAYLNLERYLESVKDFSEALKRDPDEAQTWFERGYAYSLLGEHKMAVQDYSEAMGRDPGHRDSYARRAESYEKLERYQDAMTDYKNFLKMIGEGSTSEEITERINNLQLKLDPMAKPVRFDPDEEVSIWEDVTLDQERKEYRSRDRGEELLNKGDLDGAYKEFSAYIKNVPNSVIPYVYRACVNYKAGKLNEAAKDLTDAIECDAQIIPEVTPFSEGVDPKYENIYLLKAYVNSELGKQEEVQNDLVAHLRFTSERSYIRGIWSRSLSNYTAVEALGGVFAGTVKQKPAEASTSVQNAILALIINDRKSALDLIGKVIKSDSKNPIIYWVRGLSQPDSEDAFKDFAAATELAGGKAEHFYVQGFKKMLNNKIQEGRADLLKAISLDPNNAEYHEKLGVFLSKSNQHDEAIEHLTKAIELKPSSKDAYFTRGVSLDWKGAAQAALADLEKAITLEAEPGNLKTKVVEEKIREIKESEAKKQALLLNLGMQSNKLSSVSEYIARGQASLKADEWEPAYVDFNEAIKLDPKNAEAYRFRGATFYKLGDSKSALQDYNQAIALDPNNSELYLNRGILQADDGDSTNALADLDEAIRLNPKNAMAFHMRAKVHAENWFDRDSINQATEDFEQAIKLNPDDSQVYFSRAEFWRQPCFRGTERDGLADLDQAIRLAPDNAAYYLARFRIKADLKDVTGASDDLTKAYQLDPSNEEIKSMLDKLYGGKDKKNQAQRLFMEAFGKFTAGDIDGCLADLKQAAQLDPDNPAIKDMLSELLQSRTDVEKAIQLRTSGIEKFNNEDYEGCIEDLSRAEALTPAITNDYTIIQIRGWAKLELEQYEAAIQDFTEAIRLEPDSALVYFTRASAKEKMGDYLGAIPDLENYVQLGGNPIADMQQVRAHIEEVKEEYGWEGSSQQLTQQIRENSCRIEDMTGEIETLRKERNGLGLLAFGKKKELDQKIIDLGKKLEENKRTGEFLKKQLRELEM